MLKRTLKIADFMDDLLSVKINRGNGNDTMDTAQELVVKKVLRKHGFAEMDRSSIGINGHVEMRGVKGIPYGVKQEAKELHHMVMNLIREGSTDIPLGNIPETGRYYIHQPLGSQGVTDFLLFMDGNIVHLECKSAKADIIVWNDSPPRKNVVYFTTCFGKDENTFVLGQDVCSGAALNKIDVFMAEVRKKLDNLNEELKSTSRGNSNGMGFYIRPKYHQKGGASKTTYVDHPSRAKRERRVMEYLTKISTR